MLTFLNNSSLVRSSRNSSSHLRSTSGLACPGCFLYKYKHINYTKFIIYTTRLIYLNEQIHINIVSHKTIAKLKSRYLLTRLLPGKYNVLRYIFPARPSYTVSGSCLQQVMFVGSSIDVIYNFGLRFGIAILAS